MKKVLWWIAPALAVALVGSAAVPTHAQGLEIIKGKGFDRGLVRDFYLEGNAIPTQKRNAVMVKAADGRRMVFALLDTSGYGTDVQVKYIGMAIVEQKVSLGGVTLGVGAWGFGLEKATPPEGKPATLRFYDVAGQKVGEATVAWDAQLKSPVPLQVVTGAGRSTLYLGRYAVAIQ